MRQQRQNKKTLKLKVNGCEIVKIGRGVYEVDVLIDGEHKAVSGSRSHCTRAAMDSTPNYAPEYAGYASTLCQACDEAMNQHTATCDDCGAKLCDMCYVTSPFCPLCDGEMTPD